MSALAAVTLVTSGKAVQADGLCSNAATQPEINSCMAAERDKTEAKLAHALAEVRAQLSGKELEDLDKAQQAWLQYQKLNCAAEAGLYEGGTIRPTIQLGCEAKLADDRVTELGRIYDPSRR